MTTRRPSSTKLRRQVFDANKFEDPLTGRTMLRCHLCSVAFNPATTDWECEHVIRRVLSNDDSIENLKPAHVACHREKTSADVTANAKGRRVRDKHFGIERRHKRRWTPEGFKRSWKTGRLEKIGGEE